MLGMAETHKERLEHLAKLKATERALKKQAEQAANERKAYEAALYEDMHSQGVHGLRTDSRLFSLRETLYHQVTDEDAFRQWCEENDLTDAYFTPTRAKGRLNELVRERLETGEELPPGLSFYPDNQIAVTET